MAKEKILVVEDEADILELVRYNLSREGYHVTGTLSGEDALRKVRSDPFDLIVLDLMLPGMDGLAFTKTLKSDSRLCSIPIIMLTARGEVTDKVVGLELGADDYLPKPFNPRELLARIRAVLRRHPEEPAATPAARLHSFGEFSLDMQSQTLTRNDTPVTLTSGDFSLLKIFVEHPNRVLSRDTLVEMLSGYERSPFDRSIDIRIARIRQKIEADPANAPAKVLAKVRLTVFGTLLHAL